MAPLFTPNLYYSISSKGTDSHGNTEKNTRVYLYHARVISEYFRSCIIESNP